MAATDPAPPDQSAQVTQGVNPWFIAAAVMLATFMEVLDTAIASVALPYIAGSLSATTDEATWVLTSYLVANAIILPASNWCSLRFGRKRFLMTCVAIFTVASFACGAAPTLAFLLIARVIQGAGGGALQPLSQALLLESFPPVKRGAAMAVFAFGVVVAPVLGPTLGGWLTDTYSWRKYQPMVDLKLLKNRNFGVGCALIFLFGIAIYSTIVVLPLFYQELLAYTAGLVVAPRGIGAICGMPIIGYLSNKVDPRYLLTFGFGIFGLTTLYFGTMTLGISPTTLLAPILIAGFALSFVFVPINIAAYGTLRNQQIGNASGLFNLMRNVGGSIGISIAQTLLTRRTAVHQNEMLNAVPVTGQQFQNSLGAAQQSLTDPFGPANSLHPAQAQLYQQLGVQASLWSFVDVFRWLCLLSFLCLAVVWLFKKVRPGRAPAGAH